MKDDALFILAQIIVGLMFVFSLSLLPGYFHRYKACEKAHGVWVARGGICLRPETVIHP